MLFNENGNIRLRTNFDSVNKNENGNQKITKHWKRNWYRKNTV